MMPTEAQVVQMINYCKEAVDALSTTSRKAHKPEQEIF
jgi:hypothetical protein